MGGQFSKDNRPILADVYTDYNSAIPAAIQPGLGGIVALAFTHTWGPLKTATLVNSFSEFESKFGSELSPGRIAVAGAFTGEGVQGFGGAGAVLCYRLGGSAAAKASKVITNTTPATALTLTAKYEGTRGNELTVTVQDNAADATKCDVIINDGTVELERYTFLDADVAGGAAAINAASEWVTAVANITGVALATTFTNSPLTGGNDGSTITGGDVTNMVNALEVERFAYFAMSDLQGQLYSGTSAAAVLTSIQTWVANLNLSGKRFEAVVGGALNESNATANTRSGSINNENVVNVGQGSVQDDVFGVLSTSQLAPRLAGVLAQRGEHDSSTFARLAGVKILAGPTQAEKLAAFKAGTWVFGRDSTAVAPVRMERAVTTFTTTTNVAKPYLIYRNPKFVRTMQGLEMEITAWAEENIIGKVPVNQKSRDAVLIEMRSRLAARVAAQVIQPNPTVVIDPDPPASDDDEFIALAYGVKFGRSVEQVFNLITVS